MNHKNSGGEMSRIGLIGDNSTDYVKIVINAWNNGDSVVLNDTHLLIRKCRSRG